MLGVVLTPEKRKERDEVPACEDGAGQARNGEQRNEPRPSSMRNSNEANPGV